MTKSFTTFSSAIALSMALAATAAHADATSFDGFYGGFSLGIVDSDVNQIPSGIDTALSGDVFVGYNHALNTEWVVGAEISYGMSSGHDASALPPLSFDLENALTLSGRVGYVFDNTMIYGRVGFQTADFVGNFAPVTFDAEGVVFGLGIEHMFSDNVSGRFEISHSNLDVTGLGVPPGTELEATRFSIGVAYHF